MNIALPLALLLLAQDRPPLPPPPGLPPGYHPPPSAPAIARPQGAGVRLVGYVPDAPVSVSIPTNRQLTIAFPDGERVENVALGDSNGWQVALSARGDHLFVKPVQGLSGTNMTVITTSRTYLFELSPDSGYDTPVYTLRFLIPETGLPPAPTPVSAPTGAIGYRLTGTRAIRPSALRDDGVHTYLEWPEDVAMPAVFGIDETGEEMLVDGYVRRGVYTIDRVYARLVFRMGKARAQAERQVEKPAP